MTSTNCGHNISFNLAYLPWFLKNFHARQNEFVKLHQGSASALLKASSYNTLAENGETGKTGTAILPSFHSLHTYQALTARQVTRYVFLSTTYESNHWKHDGASWIHTKYLKFIAITDVISCPLTFYVWCIPLYINIYRYCTYIRRYCMFPYVKLDCRYCMILDSKSVFHSPIKPPFLRCVMRGFTKSEQHHKCRTPNWVPPWTWWECSQIITWISLSAYESKFFWHPRTNYTALQPQQATNICQATPFRGLRSRWRRLVGRRRPGGTGAWFRWAHLNVASTEWFLLIFHSLHLRRTLRSKMRKQRNNKPRKTKGVVLFGEVGKSERGGKKHTKCMRHYADFCLVSWTRPFMYSDWSILHPWNSQLSGSTRSRFCWAQ